MPKELIKTAIDRFREGGKVEVSVNSNSVYATYTSGTFNGFYAHAAEAIAHCANPNNGVEFNGEWLQDQFTEFDPGELFVVGNESTVYISNDRLDVAMMGRWQVPFVEWTAEIPLAV